MQNIKNGIWLLLDSSKPGGIESHVLQLAVGLSRYGENVKVVFLTRYGEHPLRTALHSRGIATDTLDGHITTLWKEIRKARPSVIHTHGYKAGILGRLAARLSGVPVVSTYHAGEHSRGRLAVYDWLDRQSARLASAVFAVSPQIASRLPVVARQVDNFVDTTESEISSGGEIAFVGRLSEEKGPDIFLRLASRLPGQDFHVYGGGPQSSVLSHSATSNVRFHGQQDDMTRVWSRIGLLVMPSRHEGLPMAALEAMARGIPVLASDVGALGRLIDSGANGWLVKPGELDALIDRLSLWLDMSKQKQSRLSMAARQRVVERFSAKAVIPRLISSYGHISATERKMRN